MTAQLEHPALDAVLSAAATLLGMEVVFLGGLTDDAFTFQKVRFRDEAVDWPGVFEGRTAERADSFCQRMLEGAPTTTCDAMGDVSYRTSIAGTELGIQTYVGVPVLDSDGVPVATLCGIDRGDVEVSDEAVEVLRELARVLSVQLGPRASEQVVIRQRPQGGWAVGDAESADDLTSAMVLADLLAGEIVPPGRPPRAEHPLDEVEQLRLSVKQLEHALAARVTVEQAIGVLAERQGNGPRDAFERLRKVARSRGRKVHDLAKEVVASATDHSVPLPPELAGNRRT